MTLLVHPKRVQTVVVAKVEVSKRAEKSLKKAPQQVVVNFAVWKGQIEMSGLAAVQAVPGYNDEALTGRLKGVRSVRLSQGYRAYYRIIQGQAKVVYVEEVNKHEYKKIERIFGY